MKKKYIVLFACFGMICLMGCEEFLDAKPDKSLAIPTNLEDLQGLLDYYPYMNSRDPGAGEVSSDDYYLTDAVWNSMSNDHYRRMYHWDKENLFPDGVNNWQDIYNSVYYAGIVLDGVEKVERTARNLATINDTKGQALFYRAKAYLQIATIWALAYDEATAATDMGIPLRLTSDFNEVSVRASVKETYDQIITDLEEAIELLPVRSVHVIRPNRPAAHALLARTYLAMRKYPQAFTHADASLKEYRTLLDYNSLDAEDNFPVAQSNAEILHQSWMSVPQPLHNSRARINPDLYGLYADNDLRKTIFFKDNGDGSYAFKGSYQMGTNLFSGVAVDEVYLMRAECYARDGKVNDAMSDLNTLLEKRWKAGTFVSLSAETPEEALQLVLTERRKELLMRGLRWMDTKRLNKEGYDIVLERQLNNQTYTLAPGDPRFALPIPENVVELSGIPQNIR